MATPRFRYRSCFDPSGDYLQCEDIKQLIAQAIDQRKSKVIIADRASGKTTVLLEVVASRMLIVPLNRRIVIGSTDQNRNRAMLSAYMNHFPHIRVPEFWYLGGDRQVGQHVDEVYVDEWFSLGCEMKDNLRILVNPGGFIIGVGTPQEAIAVPI